MSNSTEITLSDEAFAKALTFKKDNPEWQTLPLRLYLDGKGCDGFYYGVSFDPKTPEDLSITQTLGDDSVEIITDPDTATFVQGSQIIWVDDERGQGFLVQNPNHRKFRGKFYKRRHWQEKLEAKRQSLEPTTESQA